MRMSGKTHWKKLYNPDYLGAYALEPGQDMVVTIREVRRELITGADGKKEECMVMYFREDIKPMVLNSTNAKAIQKLYKTPFIEEWAGKRIQLFADKVKAFGEVVEALRIRPNIPKAAEPAPAAKCEQCGGEIAGVSNMTSQQLAAYTRQKYGRAVCAACATRMAQEAADGADE